MRVKVNYFLFFMIIYYLSFSISYPVLLLSLTVGVGGGPRHPRDCCMLLLLVKVGQMGFVSVATIGERRTRGDRCLLPS